MLSHQTSKTLLLIRLDAIGDYLLFRNFIEVLKKSARYQDYKITLLGNSAWQSIAEIFDSQFIDYFIWIDREKFYEDDIYRGQILNELALKKYDVLLSSVYSREFYFADEIVKLISATEKIGSSGNLANIEPWQKSISDQYYTRLIQADDQLMFEFYRNQEFFQNLFNEKLTIKKPSINTENSTTVIELPEKYAVLFIGASTEKRKWAVKNFIAVAEHLQKYYGLKIVLCGGIADIAAAAEFADSFNKNFLINLVGKTTLLDLVTIIKNAQILISNETSAPHFAVALETKKIVVIYTGKHFGRFTPYPKEITENYHLICHPVIENNKQAYQNISNQQGYVTELNINDITAADVIKKINAIFQ